MTAARILRALCRILRRLVRRATKPLRLWLTELQLEKSRENVSYFESVRAYLVEKEQQELARQSQLAAKRIAIEEGFA